MCKLNIGISILSSLFVGKLSISILAIIIKNNNNNNNNNIKYDKRIIMKIKKN